jgi:hypothetical protein
MRRPARFVLPITLALLGSLTLQAGCRPSAGADGRTPDDDRRRGADEVALPDPLPLPDEPRAASWIAEPSRAVSMLAPYSPVPIDLRALAEQALMPLTEPALATELASSLNPSAPFGHVMLDDGQEIIRIGVKSDAREALAGRLAQLEPAGEFGAVKLPRKPSEQPARAGAREWLAWIDEADGGSLVLANSLEGLVTARKLASTYGTEPVYFTVDASMAANMQVPVEVPFSRVSGHGTLDEIEIEAQAIEGSDPLAETPIAPGTLGGLLDDPALALGGSTRYAPYQDVVRDITTEVNANVRELPFLVKGVGEDLAAKLNTTLRTWDGRVFVGIGPANHVRLAYGANDVNKSSVAALRLLQSVVDNVSFARNFVSQLPKLSLRRRVDSVDGVDIELFVVGNAASLAPEIRPLVDQEGRLNIAMAWSERAGGGLIVIGPTPIRHMMAWLEATKASPSHQATAEQLLTGSFAVAPEVLVALLNNPNIDLATVASLSASGPRWDATVKTHEGGRYVLQLRTPGPAKPTRAKTP